MSGLLVDTHALLWWIDDDVRRLGEENVERFESSALVVSAVCFWEASIKRKLGKLDAPLNLLARVRARDAELLDITPAHADLAGSLSLHHRDPFDRLLVAQSLIEGMPLVTKDAHLARYGIEVVW